MNIHTGIFQGKIKNFPGLKTPPVRSSDPTVQYSVGPMVRSYTRHVPILRTFFISELLGSRSSGLTSLTCQKKSQKLSRAKLSRAKLSRRKLSRGKLSRGKLSRGKLSGGKFSTFQGKNRDGTHRVFRACDAGRACDCCSGPPCGPGEVLDALRKSEPCTFQQSFWAVTPHELTDSLTHTHTVLLGLHVERVRGLKRRECARRAACNTGCQCHGPFGHWLTLHLAWLRSLLGRTVAMTRRPRRLVQQNCVSVGSRHKLGL